MSYLWHVLTMINLYAMLAMALNLITGYTGLLSMCQGGLFGIGAYLFTLLAVNAGWGFLPAAAIAVIGTAILSLLVALPTLRLRGEYFVLGTLGFQMIIFTVLYNWVDLTGGPYGIPGISAPTLAGFAFDSPLRFWLFCSVITVAVGLCFYGIVSSPFGRVLRAIRDDEIATASLGKNVFRVKVVCFALSAAMAAIAGALYASYARYIDPFSFTLSESIFVISLLVIGGAGSFWGPVVGAVILVLLPEALRFLEMPAAIASNVRQIIYGMALILLMRFRRQGILGGYGFE